MSNIISFGTDGWRGIIAENYTFQNVRVCAQAVANYVSDTSGPGATVVVGYDTRFASEDFAAATAEVLAANGVGVVLFTKAAPTPVISHAVVDLKAQGGIVITASHNPARWNGFKYKAPSGSSAPVEVIAEIEKHVATILKSRTADSDPLVRSLNLQDALKSGIVRYYDPIPAYEAQLRRLVDVDAISKMQGTVVVDSMYGAGSGYLADMLKGGNLHIQELHEERNPSFPNIRPEPIAANLTALSTLVPETQALVGIATDGDADRFGIVDENGLFMTQHQVFALLALYLLEVRKDRGMIVRSVTTTDMLTTLGAHFDVPVVVTPVGFKYIAPLMVEQNALIGGEESGGYAFRGHVPERDGILAALFFLDMIRQTGKSPSSILAHLYEMVGTHHYDRLDIELSPEDHSRLSGAFSALNPATLGDMRVEWVDRTDGVRLVLQDKSWVLYRLSGTEPLLRIYAEAESPERVQQLIGYGAALLGVKHP
ncbi:MAG: phosphoglucomutase/phosphomannomutase family protein [Dehalococcoidia bacterium]|nr:phosphoglucomutase/phosphomannomutase family protein [Dehalococcoidia bacterium]